MSSVLGFIVASTLRSVPLKDAAGNDLASTTPAQRTPRNIDEAASVADWDDDAFMAPRGWWAATLAAWRGHARNFSAAFRELASQSTFWKYLTFALFLTNLRQAFRCAACPSDSADCPGSPLWGCLTVPWQWGAFF